MLSELGVERSLKPSVFKRSCVKLCCCQPREDIKNKQAQGGVFDTHIIVNPANTREWIVMLKKGAGTSFFLVDDQEQVESFADLNGLIEELRLLGIKAAEIHL